jgi:hypothetical protein
MKTSSRPGRQHLLTCCVALLLQGVACDRAGLSTRLREEAETHLAQGRVPEAESALQRALSYDPNDQHALERLLEIQLRHGDHERATRWLSLIAEQQAPRSVALDNLALRVRLRTGQLERGIADAATLRETRRLHPKTEQDLLSELVRRELEPDARGALSNPALPEPWFLSAVERLIDEKRWARAATLLLSRAASPAVSKRRSLLLERLRETGWAVDDAVLEPLTANPTDPLSYLGRLELCLRSGREFEALRLDPPKGVLSSELMSTWNLRWARYFAQRSDWYGVLTRSELPATPARIEAERRALRTLAQLRRADAHAALAELEAWLSQPDTAAYWGEALMMPELTSYRAALTELRAKRDRRKR